MAISSSTSGVRPGVCTSTTRPTSPYTGQLIFETDTFNMKFWNGTAWQGAVSAPAGTVNPYAGSTAPTGWLLAYGQTVSRTTYADLFAALGTTYGVGDGSTTFGLPDMRGRSVRGKDDMGGTAASRVTSAVTGVNGTTLGAAGGDQNYQSHTHANTVTNNAVTTGAGSAHTHSQNAHEHNLYFQGSIGGNRYMVGDYLGGAGTSYFIPSMTTVTATAASGYAIAQGVTATNNNESAHTHSVTSNVSISNTSAGTGASANLPPTIILNYIIKF